MAISKTKKQEIVKQVTDILKKNALFFFVDFSNAKTSMVLEMKKIIQDLGASYLVVKKNLLRVALEHTKQSGDWLGDHAGSFGIVYAESEDKQVEIAKAMQQFVKSNSSKIKIKDSLSVLGGLLNNVFWDKSQVIRLSQIPTKEVLRGQLVNVLAQPMIGLAHVLSGTIQRFLLTLKEIEKTKR